ncbi:MAG: hypothetical protein JSW53_04520 [Candidatus Bathyarchaeota archaeon]|nr:MAG: hypothetical protein JSW53_04520 [Candidatus Bathyarchaeota archaeon]
MFLTLLVDYAPYILVLGGISAASWLIKDKEKTMSYLGFFVGIFLLTTAAVVWSEHALDTGTVYLLIATGLALFLKPIRHFPWAALFGLTAGCACAAYIIWFASIPETVFGIPVKWIYVAAFLIPALIVYIIFKFVEDLLRLIGIILAFKPVTLILAALCLTQGVLLLLNTSLFTLLA